MKLLTVLVFVCLTLSSLVQSFSINSAEVQGDGKEETRPAKEHSSVTLRCTMTMSTGEEWNVCQWSHVLKGQYDQSNKEMNIQCTALPTSQGAPCTNHGGSHQLDSYAQRIKMDVSQNHCGLIISDALSDDNGQWECRVTASSTTQYNALELFMTNHSIVRMSEPDAWASTPEMIKYDLDQSRPEIRAACRGYGGRPQPTFNWFISDDRHQLNKNDYTANPVRSGNDPIYGLYVEESITFSPTYDKLCKDYGLDSVCRTDVFTFNLICKTDQGSYYTTENRDAASQALVEVRNGAQFIAGSILLLLGSLLFTSKFS